MKKNCALNVKVVMYLTINTDFAMKSHSVHSISARIRPIVMLGLKILKTVLNQPPVLVVSLAIFSIQVNV